MNTFTYGDPTYSSGAASLTPVSTAAYPTPSSVLSSLGLSQRDKIVREIVEDGYWIKMTGSRVTKDGWTDKSDWDYVVYDPDKKLGDKLIRTTGWAIGGSGNGTEFSSFKCGDVNLILVDKEEVWKKYIIATNLIKTLNSKTKGERIAVFDSVFGKDKNAAAVEF